MTVGKQKGGKCEHRREKLKGRERKVGKRQKSQSEAEEEEKRNRCRKWQLRGITTC